MVFPNSHTQAQLMSFTGQMSDSDCDRWYQQGLLHREEGPAVMYKDGSYRWYNKGNLHKTDGPAVIYMNGTEEWWLDGKCIFSTTIDNNNIVPSEPYKRYDRIAQRMCDNYKLFPWFKRVELCWDYKNNKFVIRFITTLDGCFSQLKNEDVEVIFIVEKTS